MDSPKITVIGSINMDLLTETSVIPNEGVTVMGERFSTMPGGKGANQAVAAARLGAEVSMIGCVGDDEFGHTLLDHLAKEGIFTNKVKPVTHSTGVANITVHKANNRIIIIPGANYCTTPTMLLENSDIIANSDVVLIQLEIPYETVIIAIELANRFGVKTILNPAPAQPISRALLNKIDYITPNEHEIADVLSMEPDSSLETLIEKAGHQFIVTKGSEGVFYLEDNKVIHVPSFSVDVVDTTGAGDAFNGAFAVAIGRGYSIKEACVFANAVGALTVSRMGAQTGMPSFKEAEDLVKKAKIK
ncbi:ribokinase [Pullulanibacillus camelliae]|uniref:Ribokinase n=1 Tax=Pullulanibacillus camelliae TaxID=1707096 RepID=A0A8J2YEZ4_9BACL|nr:ribokinase [Pullulanibacillus camelliae]GGE27858.1 ribokinase [Pullulanibacillus camelliae]